MKRLINWFKWHFYWKYEIRKCKTDPHYFYLKYWKIEGKPTTTFLTKEEFNKQYEEMKNYVPPYHKRSRRRSIQEILESKPYIPIKFIDPKQ